MAATTPQRARGLVPREADRPQGPPEKSGGLLHALDSVLADAAQSFRARYGLPRTPGLEAHDAMHALLGQPPTPGGERVVLSVQAGAALALLVLPKGSLLRPLVSRALALGQPERAPAIARVPVLVVTKKKPRKAPRCARTPKKPRRPA
jgi:hypothetical protein